MSLARAFGARISDPVIAPFKILVTSRGCLYGNRDRTFSGIGRDVKRILAIQYISL